MRSRGLVFRLLIPAAVLAILGTVGAQKAMARNNALNCQAWMTGCFCSWISSCTVQPPQKCDGGSGEDCEDES